MNLRESFEGTYFPSTIVEAAIRQVQAETGVPSSGGHAQQPSVTHGSKTWTFDNLDEFFLAREEPHSRSTLNYYIDGLRLAVVELGGTHVEVDLPTKAAIVRVIRLFDDVADKYRVQVPKQLVPTQVFLGHGRTAQWRDLSDHLQNQQGIRVVSYEAGSRVGNSITEILGDMLDQSTMAFLVMTGEDQTVDGGTRARQNVIHETGLFQGRLGFSRAIVLLEEGTDDYSNLAGVQQIRYGRGKIRETFGDVVAAIRREFPEVG